MKYVKLVAKPDTWFKEGTEVYEYDSDYEQKKRITLDYWNDCVNSNALIKGICVRGIHNEDGEEMIDGEFCPLDEFDVEIIYE